MQEFYCNNCHKVFPAVAHIHDHYLNVQSDSRERVVPGLGTEEQKKWADDRFAISTLVQIPCCPRCFSTDISFKKENP